MLSFEDSAGNGHTEDEALKSIEGFLVKLERAVVSEYRRLLDSSHALATDLLAMPQDARKRYGFIAERLVNGLMRSGGPGNLRVVSDFHEDLRMRLMVLEHLLERDVPYAYLERAMNCALEKVVLIDRDNAETDDRTPPLSYGSSTTSYHAAGTGLWDSLVKSIFGKSSASATPKKPPPRPKRNSISTTSIAGRGNFFGLPDYLKRLCLLYHFMELDELNIIPASAKLPALGRQYSLQGSMAVFEAEDLAEYHWRDRAHDTQKPGVARNLDELREKLKNKEYKVGEKSRFSSEDDRKQRLKPHNFSADRATLSHHAATADGYSGSIEFIA